MLFCILGFVSIGNCFKGGANWKAGGQVQFCLVKVIIGQWLQLNKVKAFEKFLFFHPLLSTAVLKLQNSMRYWYFKLKWKIRIPPWSVYFCILCAANSGGYQINITRTRCSKSLGRMWKDMLYNMICYDELCKIYEISLYNKIWC